MKAWAGYSTPSVPKLLPPQSCAGKGLGIGSVVVRPMDHTLLASPWPGDAVEIHGSPVPPVLPSSFG